MNKKILIGIAWPYVNGDIHVGHLGGYLLPADITARFHRLCGNDVLMVSGSDCYGTPITVEADKRGLKPQEVVDTYHAKDVELFKLYNLSYNLYTKTTTEEHKGVVHEVFLQLLINGYIEKGMMEQYYSVDDRQFLPDRYVEGTCFHCNATNQRSDQCENCGRWLKDGELLNPVSKLSGSKVTLKDTEHYFLNFKKLEPELRKYLDLNKDNWKNWVWQEADGWLKEGLQKRAITRDMDWSMDLPIEEIKKLPLDKQLSDFTGKKIYVWFEAVIGYLSATRAWCDMVQTESGQKNKDIIFNKQQGQGNNWKDWWQNPDAIIYNFMGQDNLVFHTLMWPAELIGMDQSYTLPKYVVVNKFLNYEGKKFSKSRNWTINSKEIADKYGVDLVRFYIARNLPENKEGNFTWEDFVITINNELVANLGNFINRTLKFLESKFDGELNFKGELDPEIMKQIDLTFKETREKLEKGSALGALESIMALSGLANQYFDKQQIWKVIKEDRNQAEGIMANLLSFVGNLMVLISPYLPESAERLNKLINLNNLEGEIGVNKWELQKIKYIKLNSPVEVLFNKLELEKVLLEKV